MSKPLLKMLSQDKNVLLYRPHLCTLIGSVTATILFQQIAYWYDKQGGSFYKYKEPCKADDYKPGDSWCEETAFSRAEFDNAIQHIGTKLTNGVSKEDVLKVDSIDISADDAKDKIKHLVIYWTDSNRRTHYQVNEPLAENVILKSLEAHSQRNEAYRLKRQSDVSDLKRESDFSKSEKVTLPVKLESDFTIYQETTQRIPKTTLSPTPP